ncbi:MAG TPA: HAMP domain-containing sensor histidine kinase [Candidatus Elarobacter sp.]|jgi:two-component system OmpR family sensor kinase
MIAYVGAAVGLMVLIGSASTLYAFRLYAETSNIVIDATTRTLERRIAAAAPRHLSLDELGPLITADIGRPRIHVGVYGEDRRLISETGPPRESTGVVGAVASLMGMHRGRIVVPGGFVLITTNLDQLQHALQEYWTWMLPVGVVAVFLAWLAGFSITREAVRPLRQISAAMRRFADGDFRPHPLRSLGGDELGELAHSYNGALHQVQSALAQRDRSEAEIRQFIADAGHELRTPLTVVMGYLDVLEDGMCEAPAMRRHVVGSMRQESRRMRALIENLIYLARLDRGAPPARHVVDVSDVAARVVAAALPEEPATIAVSSAPDARVVADETDIFEAIRNLVDNALKYAPGSAVAVSTAVQGDDVVVVVRDHGPGMDSQDRAHAFDRFYRGRAATGGADGSGIGLAIVKRATERSGGTVSVESGDGDGTQFTIRLPHAVT